MRVWLITHVSGLWPLTGRIKCLTSQWHWHSWHFLFHFIHVLPTVCTPSFVTWNRKRSSTLFGTAERVSMTIDSTTFRRLLLNQNTPAPLIDTIPIIIYHLFSLIIPAYFNTFYTDEQRWWRINSDFQNYPRGQALGWFCKPPTATSGWHVRSSSGPLEVFNTVHTALLTSHYFNHN